jgi:hypothetical protein
VGDDIAVFVHNLLMVVKCEFRGGENVFFVINKWEPKEAKWTVEYTKVFATAITLTSRS